MRIVSMFMPRTLMLTGLLLGAASVAGCAGSPDSDGLDVVTSLYPLEYVAERVAGDHASVENLTSAGQEPHDLELTIRQTADLSDADLVVYVEGLQPTVDEAVSSSASERVIDAAEVADARADDPHFWLDPKRVARVAEAVADQLAEADPEHAGDYEANVAALTADLDELHRDYRSRLADCRVSTVVVSHDAFGYLEEYGLQFAPISGLSPESEPSPAHLAELQELIEAEGVTTVFSETLASPQMAQTLAEDLGIGTAVLDPLEGLGDESAEEDYLSLMRANLDALTGAQECR